MCSKNRKKLELDTLGVLKVKILEGKYEPKLAFHGGRGLLNKKNLL